MIRIYHKAIDALDWMFGKGTRTVAVINVAFLYTWGTSYILGHKEAEQMAVYAPFAEWDGYFWWAWLFFIATIQLVLLCFASIRCRILVGIMLIVSGITWLAIALNFLVPPVVNTGVTTYAVWALFCAATGARTAWVNEEKLARRAEGVDIINSRYGKRKKDGCAIRGNTNTNNTASPVCHNGRCSRCNYRNQDGARWLPVKRRVRVVRRRLRSNRQRVHNRKMGD